MSEERREGRQVSREQMALIYAQKQIGDVLAEGLSRDPKLKAYLTNLFHNEEMTYSQVIDVYFFESGILPKDIINGPLIKAFVSTNLCTDEEQALFQRVAQEDSFGEDFRDWMESRKKLLIGGVKRATLDHDSLGKLTDEEIKERARKATRRWNTEHPEESQARQKLATLKASEVAGPRIFTGEVISHIQEMFDEGLDYKKVKDTLAQEGVITTVDSLKKLVSEREDLVYSVRVKAEERRRKLEKDARAIVETTSKPGEAQKILVNMGYDEREIEWTIRRLRLRKRIDWTNVFEIEGKKFSLQELLDLFPYNSNLTVKENYKKFSEYLAQAGINPKVSESAYRAKLRLKRRL